MAKKKRPRPCDRGRFHVAAKFISLSHLRTKHTARPHRTSDEVFLLAEIGTLDGGGAFEAGTVAAPWILAFAQEGGLDDNRLGYAQQGQVAGHVSGVGTGGLDAGGYESSLAELAGVEEISAGDVLVALGVVGEHAGSVDVELDLAVFRLGSVEAELAVDVLEGTGDVAVAQVADLEVDEGVLAFLVYYIVSSHYVGGQHGRTDCQSGQSLFNMLSFPLSRG